MLELSSSGVFNDTVLGYFGKAIAFNAKKNGSLIHVSMDHTLSNSSNVRSFYNQMNVSEHDHEIWYGDPTKASKMTGNDFTKVYYNNL